MSDEFNWLPLAVDERVWAAQLLDGNHPRKPFGSWSLLRAKDGENCGGFLAPTAWSKESEVEWSNNSDDCEGGGCAPRWRSPRMEPL